MIADNQVTGSRAEMPATPPGAATPPVVAPTTFDFETSAPTTPYWRGFPFREGCYVFMPSGSPAGPPGARYLGRAPDGRSGDGFRFGRVRESRPRSVRTRGARRLPPGARYPRGGTKATMRAAKRRTGAPGTNVGDVRPRRGRGAVRLSRPMRLPLASDVAHRHRSRASIVAVSSGPGANARTIGAGFDRRIEPRRRRTTIESTAVQFVPRDGAGSARPAAIASLAQHRSTT